MRYKRSTVDCYYEGYTVKGYISWAGAKTHDDEFFEIMDYVMHVSERTGHNFKFQIKSKTKNLKINIKCGMTGSNSNYDSLMIEIGFWLDNIKEHKDYTAPRKAYQPDPTLFGFRDLDLSNPPIGRTAIEPR